MANEIKNYSTIILAGGKSARMGYPKPWLKKENNTTFLADIVTTYKLLGLNGIVVVLNENFASEKWQKELAEVEQNATIIINSEVDNGRLYSIQLGINATKSENVFIHNVDNPFVECEVLKQLLLNTGECEITIPSYKGKGGHPVIINKSVKNEILKNYQDYGTLKDVFSKFSKKYIEINCCSILININTPQDFKIVTNESV